MERIIDLDLFTKQSRKLSIMKFLNLSETMYNNLFADRNSSSYKELDYLEYNKDLLSKEVFVCLKHLSRNRDKCESIRNNGLYPPKSLLSEDGIIKSFFKNLDVSYNESNNSFIYKGETITNITYKLSQKLNNDNTVNGFLLGSSIESYGSIINIPELIGSIAEMCDDSSIAEKWVEKSKLYIIDFQVNIDNIDEIPDVYVNNNLVGKTKILEQLLKIMLEMTYHDLFSVYEQDNQVVILKPGYKVHPNNILNISSFY